MTSIVVGEGKRTSPYIDMADCDSCSLQGPEHVPGWGCEDTPRVMFIGEAPGADEDRMGKPFVGKAGKLLRETLTEVGMDLTKVYYTNTCMCRPKRNRDPYVREIRACLPRLEEEVRDVDPDIIIVMGNTAAKAILGGSRGITKRRGTVREVEFAGATRTVLATLHPAGVLRNPEAFPDMLCDLEAVQGYLEDGDPLVVEPPYGNYTPVTTQQGLEDLCRDLRRQGMVAVDIETTGLDMFEDRILTVGFSWERETAFVLDWEALIEGNPGNHRMLREALGEVSCSFQYGQYDAPFLELRGMKINWAFDTMLAHYVLDERAGSHGLERQTIDRYRAPDYGSQLADRFGLPGGVDSDDSSSFADIPREDLYAYNGADADYQYRLTEDLGVELHEDEELSRLYYEVVLPAAKHFAEFYVEGMLIDMPYFVATGEQWKAKLRDLEAELIPEGMDINLNSSQQVTEYLFETLKLEPISDRRTVSTGELLEAISEVEDEEAHEYWSTAASTIYGGMKPKNSTTYMLYWLAQQHWWPRLLVQHRKLSKKIGTYYDGLLDVMGGDHRIRPRFRVQGTRTGRVSASEPNIHGTPRDSEIKNFYVADPGYTLIHADYSQAEIRMLAHYAKDEALIEALRGRDIHTEISMRLFDLTPEELEEMDYDRRTFLRRAAKTIAFGIVYGRSAASLSPQLGISVSKAEDYRLKFLGQMPGVRKFINEQGNRAVREQEVRSLYGHRRRFPLILTDDTKQVNSVKRKGVNQPIQSSVSTMTLLAHMEIVKRLKKEGIPVLRWPHVHDGLLVQVANHMVEPSVEIVREVMVDPGFETDVHFAVEIQTGKRWGEMETVYEG